MARKPNTEERREQITLALLACIAEQGYDKATIQSIARQAGLAPGLIHYHFKSKDEILLHLVDTLAALADARHAALAEGAGTARERLGAWLDARLALGPGANAGAVAAWVVIGTEAVRDERVRAAYQRVIAAELARATALVAACMTKPERAPAIAATLVTFMEGAFQLSSAAREVMPVGYAAGAAAALADSLMGAA